jgi:adenosylcobinamide-phosphate synthase
VVKNSQQNRRKQAAQELAILGTALALDFGPGEPPAAWHPVVWMGSLITQLERVRPRRNPVHAWIWGCAVTGTVVSCAYLGARLVTRQARRLPAPLTILVVGGLLKTMFSSQGLAHAAERCGNHLEQGETEAAREDLLWLVSRDRTHLSETEMAAAAIESVAENTSDSVVAPLLAFGLFGLPGAAVYRALNTLDARIGYHGEYEYAGKAAARLDDLANLVPARVTAGLFRLLTRPVHPQAWRDHNRTESPNAGWPMAAAAGALGVCLEKQECYRLNEPGKPATPEHVRGAIRLLRGATWGAAALAAGLILFRAVKGASDGR